MWLCEQTKEQLKFIQKDFIRFYNIFESRGDISPCKKLIGFFEVTNRENGFIDDIPKPKFIPCKKKDENRKLGLRK